ncbi:tigger transposable element-derived protein 6-like [Dermacentor albipictus]|uniref:tigger transposable element-derived protein 6-like n=1 Tax=Dermacentor albipictus TaxID=60249 RepID=UPI0031FD0B54
MAKLQPLDQGIVKAFKVGYRRRLVQRLLINLQLGIELKVDLHGAIQMLAGAWNDVKKSTIVNCIRKAGFVVAADDGCLDNEDDAGCLDSKFRELSAFPGPIPGGVTARDFVSADDGVQAVADRADVELVADIMGDEDADSSSGEGSNKEDQPPCTVAELASAFSVIRRCWGTMEGAGLCHLDTVDKLEDSLRNLMVQKKKQAKVTDFFLPK